MLVLCAVLCSVVGLVIYSPTLYRMFCAATGYGGSVRQSAAAQPQAVSERKIKVYFDANVAPGLDWEFHPMQRSVETRIGEPVKAYYYARNLSGEPIVARATFNVTPFQAAPYFFKIQCFCFTDEKLLPGQSAEMPLVLYLDEQMLHDEDTRTLQSVTLSYTFYRQSDLPRQDVERARDLSAGSIALDQSLKEKKSLEFDNEAPRR